MNGWKVMGPDDPAVVVSLTADAGAADTRVGLATADLSDVLRYLRDCAPGVTG